MLNKIKTCVEQFHMISPDETVVAGVSGGADSVCLLFVLLELKKDIPFTLSVVHVNHGIRPEAGEDALFVERICREQNVAFFLFETDVRRLAKEKGISEEEAGREFRYRCFAQVLEEEAQGRGKIAVAHHMDDRAETMLFNLFRGSGLKGMAGIRPVRENIIRPLLFVRRQEIEAFMVNEKLPFCTDHTNQEDIYTRNRIRHHILPYAEEINHNAISHMSDTAERIREAEEYIRKKAENAAAGCVRLTPEQAEIDLKQLKLQETLIQKRILMYALEHMIPGRREVGSTHINELLHLAECPANKEVHLPHGYRGIRRYDRIMIQNNKSEISDQKIFTVTDLETLDIPGIGILEINIFPYQKSERIPQKMYTKWFDYDKITTSVIFRTRKAGDYLVINEAGNRQTLKKYMIDEKIVREERNKIYILADDSHVMWIPGGRISEYYKVTEQTVTILEIVAEELKKKIQEY